MPTLAATELAPQPQEFRKEKVEGSFVEMFCVKCKKKKTVPDDQTTMEKTTKGRNMLRATCPTCGTKMAKFTK
jgi:ribosomal protein S27E